MQQLTKMIESYSVDNFRNMILTDIEETKDEVNYMGQASNRQMGEVIDLIDQMTNHHSDSLAQPIGEIIEGCFREYGLHLEGLEKKDFAALKKRVGELKGMQKNLARDLEGADTGRQMLLREREEALIMRDEAAQNKGEMRIHQQIRNNQDRLLQHKQALESLVAFDKERLQETADEIKKGKDELYNENAQNVDSLYVEAKTALDTQLEVQRNFALAEQELRNTKLLKMRLEEEIEQCDDTKINLQQKSQRARKQIARTIRKTQTFLVEQEKLLKEKLLAVKIMNHEIVRLNKE